MQASLNQTGTSQHLHLHLHVVQYVPTTNPWAFRSSCLVQQYRFRDLVRHVQVTVIKRLGIHLHLPTELRKLVESQNNVELGTSDLIEIEVWPACLRYAAP
jgi:hypothetical protein